MPSTMSYWKRNFKYLIIITIRLEAIEKKLYMLLQQPTLYRQSLNSLVSQI